MSFDPLRAVTVQLLRDVPGRRLAANNTQSLRISSLPVQVKSSSVVGYGQLQIEHLSWVDERGHSNRTEVPKLDGHQIGKAWSLNDAESLCLWHISWLTLLNIAKMESGRNALN